MSLSFQIESGGGPPAGFYKANFLNVEPTEHAEYGAGLKFVFEVADGEHVGTQATRITSAKPTPKNAAGKMIGGISGTSLAAGATVDLTPFVGREFLLSVEETPNGQATRIATVMPTGAASP